MNQFSLYINEVPGIEILVFRQHEKLTTSNGRDPMALISENDLFSLGAILVGLAWVGFYVDTHPIGRTTSGVIWVLGSAMLLSNFNIIPFDAPAYGFVHSPTNRAVVLAIAR